MTEEAGQEAMQVPSSSIKEEGGTTALGSVLGMMLGDRRNIKQEGEAAVHRTASGTVERERRAEDERMLIEQEQAEGGSMDHGMAEGGGKPEEGTAASSPTNHVRGKKLVCEECGLVCASPNVLTVHMRSHTGERPYKCNLCSAAFTQKGNLIRHTKTHSDERPFRCSHCSYTCRRKDALVGHMRTHSGERPYRCNWCWRSYKQRLSLREHMERCCARKDMLLLQAPPTDLASNGRAGKRKSSVPQPSSWDLISCVLPFVVCSKSPACELVQGHVMEQAISSAIHYLGADSLQQHSATKQDTGLGTSPIISAVFSQGFPRPPESDLDRPGTSTEHAAAHNKSFRDLTSPYAGHCPAPLHMDRDGPAENGHESDSLTSPSRDSAIADENASEGSLHSPVSSQSRGKRTESSGTIQGLKVVDERSEEVQAFRCEYCRVLFLDHVMYTIHMGCHGYQQPLQCNICGYLSQDRYEFSSHIARGGHH
ncbi:Zinc finger protein Helios [Branchiostoma belcheri]|nr:Zinc finger protein Helios [Branchiostoma belcheri]